MTNDQKNPSGLLAAWRLAFARKLEERRTIALERIADALERRGS